MKRHSYVIWFTGLSGSGKSTYSMMLEKILRSNGVFVEVLDGDKIRDMFGNDLGFQRTDRITNIKRITQIASLLSRNGITVIVANIAPYYEAREYIRANLKKYLQIYLKTDMDVLKKFRRKEFYSKAERGLIKNVIGIDDTYEEPRTPHIVINTGRCAVDEGIERVVALLKKRKILGKYARERHSDK